MHISGLDVGPDLNTAIAQIKEYNRWLVSVSVLDYNCWNNAPYRNSMGRVTKISGMNMITKKSILKIYGDNYEK